MKVFVKIGKKRGKCGADFKERETGLSGKEFFEKPVQFRIGIVFDINGRNFGPTTPHIVPVGFSRSVVFRHSLSLSVNNGDILTNA
jgi:hypothetical protein